MNHLYLCVTPERDRKTRLIMQALEAGSRSYPYPNLKPMLLDGSPAKDLNPFVVWGQEWLSLRTIPEAMEQSRPFFHVDNGFVAPAKGGPTGYYRITYRQMWPHLLERPDASRTNIVRMQPWRAAGTGRHVLLALPGMTFGRAMGIDVPRWTATIHKKLRNASKRPIIVRPKQSERALADDLDGAWCVVTHSSNVAVDAVVAGVPVFVTSTSPCAPVGRCDLEIEKPVRPDREHWLASLMCQQFTLDEMRSGLALYWMARVAAQVDGTPEPKEFAHGKTPTYDRAKILQIAAQARAAQR